MRRRLMPALGVFALWGCAHASGSVLGKDPGDGAPRAIRDLKPNDQALLTGTMIEKCPTAGCWFMLKDSTGVVRVDTKSAGFTVTDVAVNSKVTVRGAVKSGSERIVVASGLRY
jgi:uncharacterized protein YdeI (BOF family)